MGALDANDFLNAVEDVTAELGKALVIRRISEGDWINESQPSLGKTQTTSNYNVTGVLLDYKEDLIDNENVLWGDKRAIIDIDGLAITIKPSDLLVDGSVIYNIVRVHPATEVLGTKVLNILQVRG